MKKIFTLLFAACTLIACTDDKELEQGADTSADFTLDLAAFDDSNYGIYEGVFSTTDSQERGVLTLTINQDGVARASFSQDNGLEQKFSAASTVVEGEKIINLVFTSDAGSTFQFSAERDGSSPVLSSVIYNGKESVVRVLKETSRAPVDATSGVWTCDTCPATGSFSSGTFSTVTTTAATSVEVMIMQNGSDIGGTYPLTACDSGAPNETCTIAGSVTSGAPGGGTFDFTGIARYDSGVGACSEFSGTWTLSGGGGLTGNFASSGPSSCTFQDNDFCAGARVLACGGSDSGDTNNANQADDPASAAFCGTTQSAAGGVWYVYTGLTDENTITVDTEGSAFDTKIWVYEGSCGALTCVGGDDDGGTGTLSSLTFPESIGTTYYIYVAGFSGNAGAYTVNLTCNPPPPPPSCDPLGAGTTGPVDDNNCPTTNAFTFTETTVGTVGTDYEISGVAMNISHTWSSDLEIRLVAPDGTTTLDLSVGNGGSSTDAYTGTIFVDGGADITTASVPFTGEFAAQGGSINTTFAGQSVAGTWTMTVCDGAGFDTGAVDAWNICFNPLTAPVAETPTAPNNLSDEEVIRLRALNSEAKQASLNKKE